jgi:hypothetical protein
MKKYILPLLFPCLLLIGPLFAQHTFTDDFERAATGPQTSSSDPNAIGSMYTISSGSWNVSAPGSNGRDTGFLSSSVSGFMYYNGVQTLRSAPGESFSVSVDAWNGGYESTDSRRMGLVVNYLDDNNYYAIDFFVTAENQGRVRFYLQLDGERTIIGQEFPVLLDRQTYYTLSAVGDHTGLTVALSEVGGPVLFTQTDSATDLTNGYAGFRRDSNTSVAFDNFSITAIPEPSAYAMLLGAMSVGLLVLRRRR